MSGAVSRWVKYPVSAVTYVSASKVGTPGITRGTALTADKITIPGSSSNQFKVSLDGQSSPAPYQCTLTSGVDLAPRFIALDMQRKIQTLYSTVVNDDPGFADAYKHCRVDYSNYGSSNGYGQFVVRSGSTGASSAVSVVAGDSSALTLLGMSSQATSAGTIYHLGTTTANSAYGGTVTVSGTYQGIFDDTYLVVITDDQPITSVTCGGGNTYGVLNAGVPSVTGDWNYDSSNTYVMTISTTNGSTMGGGTGNVPTFTVSMSAGSGDTVATPQEILYPNHWYAVGVRGLYVRFSDYPFANGDTFTIVCTACSDADGAGNGTASVGAAKYRFSSRRAADNSASSTTTSVTPTNVGTKGVTIAFTAGTLAAKDEWRIYCRAPHPEAYGVTSMDYGNVTVTTNSAVKCHQFEIMSGAVSLSTVKFSLQSHGTFSHHYAGSSDTEFHFGTVGAGYKGDGSGGASTGPEWPPAAVAAADISVNKTGGSTGSPVNLWASKQNLQVVSSADNAETIGSLGIWSDVVFTAIKLGADEAGSNSTINYRLFFDYSS